MPLTSACSIGPACQHSNRLANLLASGYRVAVSDRLSQRLGQNVRQLREARGFTQQQVARIATLPRATWSHVESGAGNPTLAVLDKVAGALQVPIEELTAAPRAAGRLHAKASLRTRRQGDGLVRQLLPDPIPGVLIDRMELPPGGRIPGVPHMPGTREYFTCERGSVVVAVSGTQWTVGRGDVLVFHGDQRHSYRNPGRDTAVGYSVVLLAR
jgi:transcriptional regulator with XRE-family HTH domain